MTNEKCQMVDSTWKCNFENWWLKGKLR